MMQSVSTSMRCQLCKTEQKCAGIIVPRFRFFLMDITYYDFLTYFVLFLTKISVFLTILLYFLQRFLKETCFFFGDKCFQVKCEAHDAPVNLTSRFFFEIMLQPNLLRLFNTVDAPVYWRGSGSGAPCRTWKFTLSIAS